MTWAAIAALAGGTYILKAIGPVVLGGRVVSPRVAALLALLPASLLAALVALNTFADGTSLTLDARAAGVAIAGIAAIKKAPFIVVIALGTGVTAGLRAAGLP